MAENEVYRSREHGSMWIIPEGPNTKPYYLPCHDLDDITESKGSITLIQCVDENGEYKTLGASTGAPEPTTTTLGTYIGSVVDWIETVQCPFGLYVMLSCGKKGVFNNWDRAMLLDVKAVTGVTRSGLVRISEDNPAMHTFDIEAAPTVLQFFRLVSADQSIESGITGDIKDMAFVEDVSCWDTCSGNVGDAGVIVTSAATGDNGEVLISSDMSGVAGWTKTTADPFGTDEDISVVGTFKVGRSVQRILVGRGSTDVASPAEVAYSDDTGATWVSVNVGNTVGEFITSMYVLSNYDLYVGTDGGRIYKSEDGGLNWEVKEDAAISTSAYNDIFMLSTQVGYAVGAAGLVVKTLDGGRNWGQLTATGTADLHTVWALNRNRVWIGSDNGVMYYSTNGGRTWGTRNVIGSDSVTSQDWLNDYYGVVTTGETVQFTINGGTSWEVMGTSTNSGNLVALKVFSTRKIYYAGNGTNSVSILTN